MHPIITIFCPFTREWAVEPWLEDLGNVEHDPALTNLCFIIDGNHHLIANTLKQYADKHGYRSFHVKINEDYHVNEVRLAIRRQRIAEIKNQSKDLVRRTDGEYIIGLEDDTVFDRLNNFMQLIQPMIDNPDVAFVEGVQLGRWGANMVGVWLADDNYTPLRIETLQPPPKGAGNHEHISGGGWYGYATPRWHYLNAEYHCSSTEPFGPDVNYGLWLNGLGKTCLVDWSINFGHRDYNKVMYADDPSVIVANIVFDKDNDGLWKRQDNEGSRYHYENLSSDQV